MVRRRVAGVVLWVALVTGVGFAVVRVAGLDRWVFLVVPVVAFTPYVAAASLVPVALAAATKRWWQAAAALVVSLALGACVLPRWFADRSVAPTGPTLRVLSANMRVGGADPAALVALVRAHRVDLFAVQELTSDAQRALDAAGLSDLLPEHVRYPLPGVGGSALYSRFPLADGGLRMHRSGSGFGQAMATVAVPDAPPVRVESVHPCAPAALSRSSCWAADLADQPSATVDGPVRLLVGDFNATLDHEPLRRLLGTGYRDAADVVGAGYLNTWPYDDRWYVPKVVIDHVLADRRVGVRGVAVYPVPRTDHRALFAELVLPRG
jgi:endonuclease/exonuclease/phosphatase (EEP) superfamily protein YafD